MNVRDAVGVHQLVRDFTLSDKAYSVVASNGNAGEAASFDCLEGILCEGKKGETKSDQSW